MVRLIVLPMCKSGIALGSIFVVSIVMGDFFVVKVMSGGGTASVVGHCFPVWTGFRGGKGVAASVGQCLATFPAYFPIDVGVAALAMANPRVKQRALTATLASCAMWVLGGLVWWRKGWPNLWGPTPGSGLPLAAAVSSSVIVSRFLAAA